MATQQSGRISHLIKNASLARASLRLATVKRFVRCVHASKEVEMRVEDRRAEPCDHQVRSSESLFMHATWKPGGSLLEAPITYFPFSPL